MRLYRPVGLNELRLIYQTGMREFPPRLPEQPIFYPVLNYPYAEKIARDWNTKREPWAGYITVFEVDDQYVAKFERQVVGASWHEELWVPAEELDEFNRHISGQIRIVGAHFGEQFTGEIPTVGILRGRDAQAQLVMLDKIAPFDFVNEIRVNQQAIYLNYAYWLRLIQEGHSSPVLEKPAQSYSRTLSEIANFWMTLNNNLALANLEENGG
jgi:hypothetical protein